MKSKLILTLLFFSIVHFAVAQKPFNPTGSYKLISNAKIVNGDTYGYAGNIDVILLGSSKIAICFFVTKGMPSYNSGSFVDTILFKNNTAVYKTEYDSTCTITFKFSANAIRVKEKAANFNGACGFGHAVVADGLYKKISDIPNNEAFSEQ